MSEQDTGEAAQNDTSVEDVNNSADDAKVVAQSVGDESSSWNFAEGVAGDGEIPEWFKSDKYKTVSDQAKAYKDLEGRFGSFTGSPEEYAEVALREELTEMGISIDKDDPIMEEALKFAKETNMNQEGLEKMVNLYATAMAAESQALENYKAEELKALGNNADTRIGNLNAWASANLTPDMVEGFQNLAQSAESVKTLERLVAMTIAAPVSGDTPPAPGGMTEEEVRSMQFEKDDYGNRRIQTDPVFRKKFEEASQKVWGTNDHTIVIGS